jgi:hypothetical protein
MIKLQNSLENGVGSETNHFVWVSSGIAARQSVMWKNMINVLESWSEIALPKVI